MEITYGHDPTRFGGLIYPGDFCTEPKQGNGRSAFAERIVKDWRFDEACEKNLNALRRKRKNDETD